MAKRQQGAFRSSSQAATCPQHTEAVNTNFYNVWLDPTGNQTQANRFTIKRSVHSTTDGLNKAEC